MNYSKMLTCSLLVGLLLSGQLNGQSYSVDDIKSFSYSGIRAIMNDKEVTGYVLFYKTDKADAKNDKYAFDLLDEKLNKVTTVKVVLPRNAYLLNCAYNGEALGLMFFDAAKGNYIFKSYDKTLKLLGSVVTEKAHRWEKMGLVQMGEEYAATSYGLHSVLGKGFIRTGVGEGKDQFKITLYDNNFKKKWSYETPESTKDFETFIISDVNDRYVTGTLLRRKNGMSKIFEYFLAVFDVETGKKLIDKSIEKSKEQLSISNVNLLEGTDQAVLQGEYYDLDDKPGVNKSKGFYLKVFDLKTGKEISEKQFSWASDINKLFNAKGKESIEDKYLNFPHSFFKAANGHYYSVFEQYKKAADAGAIATGIAVGMLGGRSEGSAMKIKVGNLWLLELDGDYNPIKIDYYEKDASNIFLPSGMGWATASMLGQYAKTSGGFDYQFLQQSSDKSTFNMAYINYDREKGEKNKTIVGNIFMAKDGSLNFDKVDMTAAKRTSLALYPAKGSNIVLSEYNSKAKTLELKLVKLNY